MPSSNAPSYTPTSTTAAPASRSVSNSERRTPLPELHPAVLHNATPSAPNHGHRRVDSLDNFFGAAPASSTRQSRHDRTFSSEALPPYSREEPLPKYSEPFKPAILSEYLFKYGFFFPLFWIVGALVLLMPLNEPDPAITGRKWLPEKTDVERQQILKDMREVEVRWSKRCIMALASLLAFIAVIVLAVFFARRMRS